MRYLAIFNLCLLLLSSCSEKEEQPSPSGCVGQNFSFIKPFNVSSPVMDYNTMQCDTISATFSIPLDWKVITEGTFSHAKAEFTGHSSVVNILWDGRQYTMPFSDHEDVMVTLILPCTDPIVKTFTIDNGRDYSSLGTLITDFEGNGTISNTVSFPGYCPSCWGSYFSSITGTLSKVEVVSSPVLALQGEHYLTVQGKASESSWFAGGVYIAEVPPIYDSPSSTYLNVMINSGGNTNTKLGISFRIGNNNYNYVLPINWNGWKMVSLKCSDFKTPEGESIPELAHINGLDFGLNCAQTAGQNVEVNLDLLIFTKELPLNNIFYTIN